MFIYVAVDSVYEEIKEAEYDVVVAIRKFSMHRTAPVYIMLGYLVTCVENELNTGVVLNILE